MGEKTKASTIEVGGIAVPFDPDKLSDTRFVVMLGDMDDPTLDAGEKMVVQSRLLRFVFGEERERIMDALADGGKLTNEAFSAFWIAFLKAANAKN